MAAASYIKLVVDFNEQADQHKEAELLEQM